MPRPETYAFRTLPDYLALGLDLVFIGINPGLYSVQRGHYFARPTNRFWPAFSRSSLSACIRAKCRRETLGPEDDGVLLAFGIGFTDVVKVPSRNAQAVRPADFRAWAPRLLERLRTYGPAIACFHGIMGYRAFTRYALGETRAHAELGVQPLRLDTTRLFVVPNPSPANAHFRLEDQIAWYDRLADFRRDLRGSGGEEPSPGR
jgi:double-stranded uracil-DNA glycosylase